MDQPDYTPTPKMTAVGVAGAATVILVWLAELVAVSVPAEVAAALTGLLSFAAGWLKRDRIAQP